jgi:hemerythrin
LAKRATAARRRSTGTAKAKGSAKAKRSTKARRSTKKTKSAPAARRKTAARAAATRTRRRKPAAKPSTLSVAGAVVRGAVEGAVVAVAKRLPWTSTENDAVVLLEADHRRFEELLKQGEKTTERAAKTRRELLDTLTRELNEHELKEEEVLYPALEPHAQAHAIVLEGYEGHHVPDVITRDLRDVVLLVAFEHAFASFLLVAQPRIQHFFFHPLVGDEFGAQVVHPLFALRRLGFERLLEHFLQSLVVFLDQVECVHAAGACNRYASTLDHRSASSSPAAR